MATVEVLAARSRVRHSVIGVGDRPEDEIYLICEIRTPERQM
jgi:hypothetical protein